MSDERITRFDEHGKIIEEMVQFGPTGSYNVVSWRDGERGKIIQQISQFGPAGNYNVRGEHSENLGTEAVYSPSPQITSAERPTRPADYRRHDGSGNGTIQGLMIAGFVLYGAWVGCGVLWSTWCLWIVVVVEASTPSCWHKYRCLLNWRLTGWSWNATL